MSQKQMNSRLRRMQYMRQIRHRTRGSQGDPSQNAELDTIDDEGLTLVVSGFCTVICALLVIATGAGLATALFSLYMPDCMRDHSSAGAVTAGTTLLTAEKTSARTQRRSKILGSGRESGKTKTTIDEERIEDSSNRNENDNAAGGPGNSPLPCTDFQRSVLKRQLPPGGCEASKDRPFRRMDCSFSAATSCGGFPHWLYNFHVNDYSVPEGGTFNAIVVGCNKAYSAMDILHAAKRDKDNKYNRQAWKETFLKTAEEVEDKSESCPLINIPIGNGLSEQKATVYCIEGMPKTYESLVATRSSYGLSEAELDLSQIVVTFEEGNHNVFVEDMVGISGVGKTYWNKHCRFLPQDSPKCVKVPTDSVDNWIQTKPALMNRSRIKQIDSSDVNHGDPNTNDGQLPPIHYMSIRVEDNDYEVLQGATKTLHRVHYLDFNYHWFGDWTRSSRSLKDLIMSLRRDGFVCYWPGEDGNMWRISDGCYQEHYEYHYYANIACVNVAIPDVQPLAEKMEEMFLKTLSNPNLRFGK